MEDAEREIKILVKPRLARQYAQGDKPGKAFGKALVWLVNREWTKSWIDKIVAENGKECFEPEAINSEFAIFYEELHSSSKGIDVDRAIRFLEEVKLPSLSPEQVSSLESPLQIQ